MKRPTIVAILLLGGIGLAAYKFLPSRGSGATKAAEVDASLVAKAEVRDLDFSLQISGEVVPASEIEIRPEVGGKVKRLHVNTGGQVKPGQILLEIDDRDLLTEKSAAQTDIEGAKLKVNLASRNFERSKGLFASKLISSEVFDNMKSALDIAKNELVKAQSKLQTVEDRLRKTVISSPSGGTILEVKVLEGQVVTAAASVNSGTLLMRIADLSRLVINTHINQVDIAQIKTGSEISFSSETFTDLNSQATIDFIAPVATVVNNAKGFQVEARIENVDPRLRPGMTVTLKVPVARAEGVVSVPVTAIFSDGGSRRVVYVRSGSGTVKREVEVGITDLFFAEITSGLQPGEEVVLVEPKRERS